MLSVTESRGKASSLLTVRLHRGAALLLRRATSGWPASLPQAPFCMQARAAHLACLEAEVAEHCTSTRRSTCTHAPSSALSNAFAARMAGHVHAARSQTSHASRLLPLSTGAPAGHKPPQGRRRATPWGRPEWEGQGGPPRKSWTEHATGRLPMGRNPRRRSTVKLQREKELAPPIRGRSGSAPAAAGSAAGSAAGGGLARPRAAQHLRAGVSGGSRDSEGNATGRQCRPAASRNACVER